MAFFTKIDENNIVKQIVVVENSIATTEQAGIEFLNNLYGKTENWKQMGEAPFTSNGVETKTSIYPPYWDINSLLKFLSDSYGAIGAHIAIPLFLVISLAT